MAQNEFDRAGKYGGYSLDNGSAARSDQYGIDPRRITKTTDQPIMEYSTGYGNVERSPAVNRQTYNGPGGQFLQKDGGQWTDSFGNPIQDLGQYTKSKELQQTGSDFSNEQNMLTGLLNDPSKIQQTAGYQFDVDQGNQAINRSAAAKGSLNSGGVLAELAKYGQGMASKEYGDQVNRLSGIIGNKQNFGNQSGFYNPKQYLNPLDINRSENKIWSWGWSGKMN